MFGLISAPGAAGSEDRPVADVAVQRASAAVGVVGLRQPPDVMVTDRLRVTGSDADLVVHGLGGVIPHLHQPVGAELRLGGEARAGLVREVADQQQHQVDGVTRGLHELEVITGVPPAAGGVHRHTERGQAAGEAARRGLVVRRQVRHRVLVVEVARRRPQRRRDVVRAVPLVLVEGQRISHRASVDVLGRVDPERR